MDSLNDTTAALSTLKNLTDYTTSTRFFRAKEQDRITPVPSVRVLHFDDSPKIDDDDIPDMYQFVRTVSCVFPKLERILVRTKNKYPSVMVVAANRLGVELDTYSRHY